MIALGPLFLGPLSEIYGRNRVMQGANMFFLIFNLACAFSQNTTQLIVLRFLSGLGGSAPLAVRYDQRYRFVDHSRIIGWRWCPGRLLESGGERQCRCRVLSSTSRRSHRRSCSRCVDRIKDDMEMGGTYKHVSRPSYFLKHYS
jgi:hypothetical protein